MSYVGQTLPVDRFSGYLTETFTGDGSTTAFTLTREPHSESAVIVVINNVVQQPVEDYTVSGTTLTIDAAVASGDVIYATHTGGVLPITESATIDLQGVSDALVLDSDADSTISADTDDQLDIKLGGSDVLALQTSALTLKNPATADNSTFTLNLQTAEADIAQDDVIGKIAFAAPNEGTGTDANLTAAAIQAVSEGDFSSSSNATSLQFMTGSSEAAAAKMYVKSNGNVSIGTANPIMSGYDANSTKLTVYDGSGSAQSGYLELGANASTNGYNAGAITFVNENNADATNNDADGKIVSMMRSTIVTSDSNAGDDSGAAIELWTKAEAGSLTKRWQVLSDGNLLPNATSTGVYLGVTSATAANLLDDYEEGTYTPTVAGASGGSFGLTSGSDLLQYTKVGRIVHIQGMVSITSDSSASGNIIISLPFTAPALTDDSDYSMGVLALSNNGSTVTGQKYIFVQPGSNAYLFAENDDGTSNYIDQDEVDANWQLHINVSYVVE